MVDSVSRTNDFSTVNVTLNGNSIPEVVEWSCCLASASCIIDNAVPHHNIINVGAVHITV